MQSTSTSISNAQDSSPLISGTPFSVNLAQSLVENFSDILLETMEEIQKEEEEALRVAMGDHPEWSQHTEKASVGIEGTNITYSVKDPNDPDIVDLEYGNPVRNVAPTGLLRSTAQKRSFDVAVKMSSKFSEKIKDLG